MPRNRRPQPKAEKRAELVSAARQLFLEDGYDATSISRVAKAASVAPNTIYWYFDDKDTLLCAVLDELLAEDLAAYTDVAGAPLNEQALWLVGRLRRVRGLMATVHARVAVSPVVADWHDRFHAMVDQVLAQQLGAPVPDAASAIASFAVEGLVTHDVDDERAREVCDALVSSVLVSGA
ncbi:MAG: TetR/AcrR family transcriptional regulator [Baekduiaceae bacterium]